MGCSQSKERSGNGPIVKTRDLSAPECFGSDPVMKVEPESRIEDRAATQTAVFGGIEVRYAYLSQRGYYPGEPHKANQDAFSITKQFATKDTDAFFAVYDGHGRDGHKCAQYARDNLPDLVAKFVNRAKDKEVKRHGADPTTLELTKDQTQAACQTAHLQCNKGMHRSPDLDDSLSGTTSISCYVHGRRNRLTVCNVGDSRAILGQKIKKLGNGSSTGKYSSYNSGNDYDLRALPLSRDQTPYRRDERARIRSAGGRILSLDQIEGLEPINDDEEADWGNGSTEMNLGEEIDEGGDPPRVWSPYGEYPGTAFTRSLGDAIAEELGVFAEPEMVTRELGPDDKIVVLASDGVFEFLTNQSVIDICAKFKDPLEACNAVVHEAYELWLQYEPRTDDITMICIFVDSVDTGVAAEYEQMSTRILPSFQSTKQMDFSEEDVDDSVDALVPVEGMRPVRAHLSKEKTKAIEEMKQKMFVDMGEELQEDFDLSKLYTEKSDDEKARIAEAIRASVMFQSVTDKQRELIFGVMEPITVRKGDWIIRQGTVGDRFYIVDHGQFEVRILPEGEEDKDGTGGSVVHIYQGSRKAHAHPSFGELALMYSAPRAASIIAQTDGQLWALHRYAFRKVLAEQSTRQDLLKILKRVPFLMKLDVEEMENVAGSMEEATYGRGETIVKQGDIGDTFYVVCRGEGEKIREVKGRKTITTLKADEYFGDETLSAGDRFYEQTVVATATMTCWKMKRSSITKTLGKLRAKRRGSGTVA